MFIIMFFHLTSTNSYQLLRWSITDQAKRSEKWHEMKAFVDWSSPAKFRMQLQITLFCFSSMTMNESFFQFTHFFIKMKLLLSYWFKYHYACYPLPLFRSSIQILMPLWLNADHSLQSFFIQLSYVVFNLKS